jgi:hypothetical protein
LLFAACGVCSGDDSLYSLEGSTMTLSPGTYTSSTAASIVQCGISSHELGASGYGVRKSAHGVDCFISTADTLTTESPASEDEQMTIFKLGMFVKSFYMGKENVDNVVAYEKNLMLHYR